MPEPGVVWRKAFAHFVRVDAELFGDPAWDMLLDLTAARAEHTRVSVTSLCIASAVPPTGAPGWGDAALAQVRSMITEAFSRLKLRWS